jgi:hypothetical protein
MDFVLWMNALNTFFQVVLCYYMWHYNRHNRPPWATGLFVACACVVSGVGGIMMYHEGKCIKRVEGVPAPKGYEENCNGDLEAQQQQSTTNKPEQTYTVADEAAKKDTA